MTKFCVLFFVALLGVSSTASAQTTMKKGDKAWTELEATFGRPI